MVHGIRHILEILIARGGALAAKFVLTLYLGHAVGLDVLGWYGLIAGCSLALPVLIRGGVLSALLRDIPIASNSAGILEIGHYRTFLIAAYGILAIVASIVVLANGTNLTFALALLWIVHCEHWAADAAQLLYALRRARAATWLTFTHSLVWPTTFVLLSTTAMSWQTLEGLLIVWAIGGTVTIAALGVATRNFIPWQPMPDALRWAMLQFMSSRAIFLQEMLNVVRDYGDRFIVGLLLGLEATGVYVFFLQFANAASTLVNSAIVFPARSSLVAAAHQSPTAFFTVYTSLLLRALTLMAALLIAVIAGLLALSGQLVPEAIGGNLSAGAWILVAGWAQMAFTLGGFALYAQRRDVKRLLASCIVALCIPVFAFAIVPIYGLPGMALSNLAATCIGVIVLAICSRDTTSSR